MCVCMCVNAGNARGKFDQLVVLQAGEACQQGGEHVGL